MGHAPDRRGALTESGELLQRGEVHLSMVVRWLGLATMLLAGCAAADRPAPRPPRTRVDSDRPTPNLSFFPPPPTGEAKPWYHDTPLDVPPAPMPDCPEARSALSTDALVGALHRCYNASLAVDPAIEGKLGIEVEVDQTGHALAVRVTQSNVAPALGACVAGVFRETMYTATKYECRAKLGFVVNFMRQRPE